MLGPNISQGLNQRGSWVSQFLNWAGTAGVDVVVIGELQVIRMVSYDGQTLTIVSETESFKPQVSTYHEDDRVCESPQHVVTGLDPQPDD